MRISEGEVSLETAMERANLSRHEKEAIAAEMGTTNSWSNRPATERGQVAREAGRKLNQVSSLTGVSARWW